MVTYRTPNIYELVLGREYEQKIFYNCDNKKDEWKVLKFEDIRKSTKFENLSSDTKEYAFQREIENLNHGIQGKTIRVKVRKVGSYYDYMSELTALRKRDHSTPYIFRHLVVPKNIDETVLRYVNGDPFWNFIHPLTKYYEKENVIFKPYSLSTSLDLLYRRFAKHLIPNSKEINNLTSNLTKNSKSMLKEFVDEIKNIPKATPNVTNVYNVGVKKLRWLNVIVLRPIIHEKNTKEPVLDEKTFNPKKHYWSRVEFRLSKFKAPLLTDGGTEMYNRLTSIATEKYGEISFIRDISEEKYPVDKFKSTLKWIIIKNINTGVVRRIKQNTWITAITKWPSFQERWTKVSAKTKEILKSIGTNIAIKKQVLNTKLKTRPLRTPKVRKHNNKGHEVVRFIKKMRPIRVILNARERKYTKYIKRYDDLLKIMKKHTAKSETTPLIDVYGNIEKRRDLYTALLKKVQKDIISYWVPLQLKDKNTAKFNKKKKERSKETYISNFTKHAYSLKAQYPKLVTNLNQIKGKAQLLFIQPTTIEDSKVIKLQAYLAHKSLNDYRQTNQIPMLRDALKNRQLRMSA